MQYSLPPPAETSLKRQHPFPDRRVADCSFEAELEGVDPRPL